ncbi:MAG: efflux RND transporter periplasmic adaptor subunit [Planctomycetia bacterium]|nr:efflux RND transporter periplasmic adaptor subunit [Planctomycetia bacterium]
MPARPRLPSFALLCLAAACAGGCGKPNAYVPPPPPAVTVATPVQQPVTEYLEFTGLARPMETVEIRARVRGFLTERHFVEGADVRQGQLLFVIDEEPFRIQLRAAETHLQEAEAALRQATASKAREVAQAHLRLTESQLLLSQQDEQRISSLYQRQVSTKSELDQAQATLKTRAAEVESDRANLEQSNATYDTTILTAQAHIETARTAVDEARLNLGYCRMHAPIDGRISRVNFDVGNLVGDAQASVLATIVKGAPIYAYATISEADALRVPGLRQFGSGDESGLHIPVELGTAGHDDYPFSGVIDYADPGFDPGTGTLRVRGVFANEDRQLVPGMFVRMRTAVAEIPDALLVPERALGLDQSGPYLLAVDAEGIVSARPVRTGVAVGDLRVVTGKITRDDRIIVEGLLRARPGSRVVVAPASPEPAAAAGK